MKIKNRLACIFLTIVCILCLAGCTNTNLPELSGSTNTLSEFFDNTTNESTTLNLITDNIPETSNTTLYTSDVAETFSETSNTYKNVLTETDTNLKDIVTVHFINVGQGDSIFIELVDGETMLIDAGEWEYANTVVEYISGLGYDTLNYVVATHPHSDHIGGLKSVFNTFNIGDVYISPTAHDTKTYQEMINSAQDKANNIFKAVPGDILIDKNGLKIVVVAPDESSLTSDDLNNSSVIIKLTYGDNSFLFTGDAEKEEEDSIRSNVKADVLKIGHHGSNSSTSYNFLKKVEPKFAVISVGKDNEYGHPTDKLLARLNAKGIETLRTDLNGTVVFTTNGKELEYFYEFDNSSIIEARDESPNQINSVPEYYVINTRSKKIHKPACSSVEKISENNRKDVNDISDLIDSGYKFCQVCGTN